METSLSEEERDTIRSEVSTLLEAFSRKLASIDAPENHFVSISSPSGLREDGDSWSNSPEFTDLQFLNAPLVEDNCIVAEKARWK